jgi:hypothetical protein
VSGMRLPALFPSAGPLSSPTALAALVNTKLRLLTRLAFGFHDPHALIGLDMLALGEAVPTPTRPRPLTPDARASPSRSRPSVEDHR